ncbi:ABC transporter ATP-binding protein [Desulfurococcus mucosus]|uniref:ABC transporter related protein n=1 Tax=Desulfurococcus mucosus (strain ATCC 35584 / DSM 2162 / JCM 9187 / O7/1) TaxID=765177 RepID=E8R8Z0_DESM0|nr:ABC transporter ATP-binding protein [Desulfurococcus mucosus]ADV64966.1 ABC transporter related protein [Desulfurococcus mucosus DSM 2162]
MVYLRVEDVVFHYRSTRVLNGVSVEIKPSSFTGIVGPNGSGKTTLLRVMLGILKPRSGVVYIDGKAIGEYDRRRLASIYGYVPQRLDSITPLTLYDFVSTGRRPYASLKGLSSRDHEAVARAIKAVGLEEKSSSLLTELSGGELQRALIARALAAEPRIMLLDEPTSNLDPYHQLMVMKLLRNLTRNGVTVVATLHDLNHAYRYPDTLILMNKGRIERVGPPGHVLTSELIYRVYGVKAIVDERVGAVVVDSD